MGTNFHVSTGPSCGGLCARHCKGETIHLGKSSAGWAFTFRAYPEPSPTDGLEAVTWPVVDFPSWLKLLDLGPIEDEYGRSWTRAEMVTMIEDKRDGVNTFYGPDFLDGRGHRFCPSEFS
jgi:hypothetical protein